MKNEVLYLLLDNYSEHEIAFLSSAIACNEVGIRENPHYINKIVAPSSNPVRSCSGFYTLPDYSFDTMPDNYAALVLIGGFGWLNKNEANKVVPIVQCAMEKRVIVGAICNAVSFLAQYGFLNNIKHTGNGLEQLQLWGKNNYTNPSGYIDEQAVSDHRIVTANGTGYLEFAKELLLLLKNDTPEQIEMFYRFNKVGFVAMMRDMQQK